MTSSEILQLVNDYINNLPYERTPQSLYEPVKYTLRLGGKRIRPVLMVLSYNLFKEDVKEIKSEQGEMKSEISDLKNAPMQSKASAFDSAWKFIVTAVATGLVAFVLGQICPQIFG